MKEVSFEKASEFVNGIIAKNSGIFLSTAGSCEVTGDPCSGVSDGACAEKCAAERPNTMTISWGAMGVFWGKKCFVAPVRPSRYTHDRILRARAFTVSVPLHDMTDAWRLCGSKSGRDMDKFAAAGITAEPAKTVAAPIVGECELHIECKVVGQMAMDQTTLGDELREKCYPRDDYHTLFFGEITACYLKD